MVSETDHPPPTRDIDGEMKEKVEEEETYIDVICIDVVICAFQNDPCGIICRGRRRRRGKIIYRQRKTGGEEKEHDKV